MMVAVCHRGDVLAGVIYDPVAHDWSMAVRGDGAWSEAGDGTQAPLKVAQPVPPHEMDGFIATGFLPEPLRTTVNGNLAALRSEEHTSELQSLMRISYAVFCLKKKKLYQIHKQAS